MLWQVVVYLFLLYMVTCYLEHKFWIIALSFAVCAGFYDLWKKVRDYLKYKSHDHKRIVNILHKVVFFALPFATLMLISDRIDNTPATIVIGFLWALGIAVKLTSDYIYVHRINIERLTGKFAETRRTLFTIVKSIPIIGKRRTPFMALKGVSFRIKTGMFGLLGPHGAGKSTLMRIITGEMGPYGMYIKTVNGILADYDVDQTYWAFYVDGEYALSGVDTTPIEAGRVYSLVLTKG